MMNMHTPGTCPKCGSWDVDEMGFDCNGDVARFYGQCNECGCEFEDVFAYEDTEWEEDDE